MTNHRRSPGSGVAGPLIASLSALVLLVGIGWFVLRETGDRTATSQDSPLTAADDAPAQATPVRPTSPAYRSGRTPSPTPKPTLKPTRKPTPGKSKPTRSTTAPSRDGSRIQKPSPGPSHTSTPKPTRTTAAGGGSVEAQVLALTNQERAKKGCGPLRTRP